MRKKNHSGDHFSGHHEQFQCALFWPVSTKYIYEIHKVREMHRHYVQADTYCFSVTAEDLNLEMKI